MQNVRRKPYGLDDSAILDAISRRNLIAEVERFAHKAGRCGPMSRELRELYHRFSWRGRAATARQWLCVITLMNMPVVAIDYLMSPALLVPGLLLRCLVIPIVGLLALRVWLSPQPEWVEALSINAFSVSMMALACTLGWIAGGDIHERYVAACFMVVSTSLVVIALRGVWPLLTCFVNCAAYAVSQYLNPATTPTTTALMTLFYAAATLFLVRSRAVANRVHARSVMSYFRDLSRMAELRQLNLKLHDMATRDALTGLMNRAAIIGHLADILDRPEAFRLVSVALIDIDHFKKLNDTLGHLEGDRCLRIVATTLSTLAAARQGCVGRYGGEEFLLVLPDAEIERALELCEELRQGIERLCLPGSDEPNAAPVTISLGVASPRLMGSGEVTLSGLLQLADEALYAVKRGGRNDVRLAHAC